MEGIRYFSQLEWQNKLEIVWNEGVFLTKIGGERYIISLFAVDSFYVEVYYDSSLEKVIFIHSYANVNPLNKFMDQINIGVLTEMI